MPKWRTLWLCFLAGMLLCGAPTLTASPLAQPTPWMSNNAQVYAGQITLFSYNYDQYTSPQYSEVYNMTYPVLDWGRYGPNKEVSSRTLDTLVMENDYLKLTLIPSLGGRIYSLEFKPTGHNELYSNPVLKPTHWGPPEQRWWMAAGGFEWCLPVEEHGYEWSTGWVATPVPGIDGVRVELRDTLDTDRLRTTIVLHLPDDRAYFTVHIRIENPTAQDMWFNYWTNAMLAPGPENTLSPDFHFVMPTDEVTVHSTGDPRLPGPGEAISWPDYQGVNWSRLGNWDQWLGFFARPQAERDFQGVYDTGYDEGLVRVFPADVARGAKGFAWGWNKAYPDEWTDGDGGYYAEMHGGLAPTFWDNAHLPAKSEIEWQETWYPAAGIGWLSAATDKAALGIQVNGMQVTLGAQPTSAQTDGVLGLWRPGEATALHTFVGTLTPAAPYQATLTPGGDLSLLVLSYLDVEGNLLATTAASTDARPPEAHVTSLPAFVTDPADLVVSWQGHDRETCVVTYDLQVRDGAEGAWTPWLTQTTASSMLYPGVQDGHTYYFRCRATDLYGNTGSYSNALWGDAFSSVLVTPAPVLETSRKTVDRYSAIGGDVMTYTLSLRNTGSADADMVWVTDTLPAQLHLLSGTLTWQGIVTASDRVEMSVVAQVYPTATLEQAPVWNTIEVRYGEDTFTRQAGLVLGYSRFLPVVFREGWP